ncbi:MAG: zf-HC2 domain-containing protein [Acidobacteriales bacterium]|nr:zf-HC2 domain-containing protein [Terriglobales bacterium]
MACDQWSDKLDAYLDGELPPEEDRSFREHLPHCSACLSGSVERLQLKRSLQEAGARFTPGAALRARIEASVKPPRSLWVKWPWLSASLAAAASLLIAGVLWTQQTRGDGNQHLVSELIDLHVATLASANPVDVISTDRHTVKPWFAGKLPFTFNLPELQGTPFTLVGGRLSFLNQSAGAELIFRCASTRSPLSCFSREPWQRIATSRRMQAPSNFTFAAGAVMACATS